jgi:drug/metabolite transporter (DMT)-like permease
MTSSPLAVPSQETQRSNKPLYMVVVCTLFASAAQILLKMGADHAMPKFDPASMASLIGFAFALAGNIPLVFGYGLHACNALLLIFALKSGELSILMPLYSLSYVWVALLSHLFFGDPLNAWILTGISTIVVGVALLGRAGKTDGYKA